MNDGGPAFPMFFDGTPKHSVLAGMSLRDYFAAAALSALIARADWDIPGCARRAYSYADSMLAEREKP